MNIIAVIFIVMAGAVAGNRIARWRGLNVGAMTAAGGLLSIVAIPFSLIAPRSFRQSEPSGTWVAAMVAVVIWLTALVSYAVFSTAHDVIESHRATLNDIINENYASGTVEVDYLSIPWGGIAPIFMSRYSGYFTIRAVPGMPAISHQCQLATIDFEGRATTDSYVLQIDGLNGAKILPCGT